MAEPSHPGPGGGFAALLGIEPGEPGDGRASARLTVRSELTEPGTGGVGTGVFAGMAEAVCAHATRAAVGEQAGSVEAVTTQTSLLATVCAGSVKATARARHRGRTTWVWDVEFHDGDGRLCAATRLTLAIR